MELIPVMLALGRQRQEDPDIKVNLWYPEVRGHSELHETMSFKIN